jgi:hypothetical protein
MNTADSAAFATTQALSFQARSVISAPWAPGACSSWRALEARAAALQAALPTTPVSEERIQAQARLLDLSLYK